MAPPPEYSCFDFSDVEGDTSAHITLSDLADVDRSDVASSDDECTEELGELKDSSDSISEESEEDNECIDCGSPIHETISDVYCDSCLFARMTDHKELWVECVDCFIKVPHHVWTYHGLTNHAVHPSEADYNKLKCFCPHCHQDF